MKHSLLFLIAAALIVACTPKENLFAQQPSTPAAPSATGKLVQMETGACRGYCPMYKLTFHNDGTLEYIGIRHVDKMGTEIIRLNPDEFSQLLKEVRKVDLWQYPAQIASTVADAPVHTYTVFDGAKTHTVKGRTDIPKPILSLENLMQDITEAHGIAVRSGSASKAAGALTGQVIVKFSMDMNAKDFVGQFTELKVRIVEHLGEDNTWMIGYNPAEITQEQFISLMKDMQGVLSVEPNKQVKAGN